MAMFHLLKIRTSIDIFKNKKCKVTFGLEYNCTPFVADLFLFCFERDLKSLTKEKRYDAIDAFNSTSRYLGVLLNIDNIHFEQMVHLIYPTELQLNKANASDTEAAFLDLNLSTHNGTVFTKIYDKGDDFDIVHFPFLDGDVIWFIYISTYSLCQSIFAC